ncbi:MAG: DUF302 domain-containing protein [Candidatus Aceula meridiana]|nr:DUF302 domain-containing protein [Candidatus Aceula meridiana]
MNTIISFILLFISGVVFAGLSIFILIPKMMIVSKESKYDFYETIRHIEESIKKAGWNHKGTDMMSEEIKSKTGEDFGVKVAGIKLCRAIYAKEILMSESSRFVSCLMPCSFSVWETDDGRVMVSKMNTGLMGRMLGGKIAEIMGGRVGPEEHEMLKNVIVN